MWCKKTSSYGGNVIVNILTVFLSYYTASNVINELGRELSDALMVIWQNMKFTL